MTIYSKLIDYPISKGTEQEGETVRQGQGFVAGNARELSAGQRQSRRQTLSPTLFRSMEMLAMPSGDLHAFLRSAVEDNVMLAMDPDAFEGICSVSLDEAVCGVRERGSDGYGESFEAKGARTDGGPSFRRSGASAALPYDDGRLAGLFTQDRLSLPQYLLCQCTPADEEAFSEVTDCLDERGYFQGDVEVIAFQLGCAVDRVQAELDRIRSLEPKGVGAQDLRDCLMLQLSPADPSYGLLRELVQTRLEELPTLRPGSVACTYGVTREEGRRVLEVLRGLDPCPALSFAQAPPVHYAIPDIVVSWDGVGALHATLSLSGTAGLSIDEDYRRLCDSSALDEEARGYLERKGREAGELLRDVSFRHRVISRLAAYILVRQRRFFESNGAFVEVLSVRDAADDLGIHPSTVSRALAGKTMRTPFGLYPLSVFFKTGVTSVSGEDSEGGQPEAVATFQVKAMIRQCVGGEDPAHPLSDSALREALVAQGVRIERRTVAKYRESMGIPCSTQRRRLRAC